MSTEPRNTLDRLPAFNRAREMDKICDTFETAWLAGKKPRIEDFLSDADEATRAQLLEQLLLSEWDLCQQRGIPIDVSLFEQRFPVYKELIVGLRQRWRHEPPSTDRGSVGLQETQVNREDRVGKSHGSLGKYKMLEPIGKGGMGAVFLAEDTVLRRQIALKLLPHDMARDETAVARFQREARLAAQLEHEYVVRVYDVGQELNTHYIAMEFVNGQELRQLLKKRMRLDPKESTRIICQVAEGLDYASQQGIIHRDIKPSNILITGEGTAKILDLGLARFSAFEPADAASLLTSSGQVMGTVDYMSPEQAMDPHSADVRSDIYSLGCTFYECLTGSPPFVGGTLAQKLWQHREAMTQPANRLVSEVSETLANVIARMMAKRPEDRFQTHAEVVQVLSELGAVGDIVSLSSSRLAAGSSVESNSVSTAPRASWHATESTTQSKLPDHLPTMLTDFIGRQTDIDRVKSLFAKTRLLTLTGPGGTGKTRLAIRVASEISDQFPAGLCFVPLDSISDAALVDAMIAQTIGIRHMGGTPIRDTIKEFLRDIHALFVLDNFEHVVQAAPLLTELLIACPHLRILVTSRASLGLRGEQQFAVGPLEIPPLDERPNLESLACNEAVALFLQRAQAARPTLQLNETNAKAIAEICHRLEGLPLAIELAAARIKVLSPRAISARLKSSFRLLASHRSDAPTRHQTLRAAIAWSYDLLTEQQQSLFRRLSVFSGGFSVEAAEATCSALVEDQFSVLEGLERLVDQNLIKQHDDLDGESRFSMLETICEFGRETLTADEELQIRSAHCTYYLRMVEEADAQMLGGEQETWLIRLDRDHHNFRAAIDWAISQGEAVKAARIAAAISRYWLVRGHMYEGRESLKRVLAKKSAFPDQLRARLLSASGTLAHNQGDYTGAREVYAACLDLHRRQQDKRAEAKTLNNLSWVAWRLGSYTEANSLAQEALKLYRELGDTRGASLSLNNLGWVAQYRGDFAQAATYFTQCLDLQRESTNKRDIGFSCNNLAWTLVSLGNCGEAMPLFEEALALLKEVGDRQLLAFTFAQLGSTMHSQGESSRAISFLAEKSLPKFRLIGDQWGIAFSLAALGTMRQDSDEGQDARRLFEESLSLRRQTKDKWGTADSLARIAGAEFLLEQWKKAYQLYRDSLRLRAEIQDKNGVADCLEGLAAVLCYQGCPGEGVRLWGAAKALRDKNGGVVQPQSQHVKLKQCNMLNCKLDTIGFAQQFQVGNAMSWEQALAWLEAQPNSLKLSREK